MSKPKILLLDIETAPISAFVWGLFKQNVALNQIKANSYIMTYSYKWLGENYVVGNWTRDTPENDYELCRDLQGVLDEADFVVAHNLKKFDLPVINSRLVFHGLDPYSPVKLIDTLEIAKKKFKFASNKLEYLATYLKCTPKSDHKKFSGMTLWTECMRGNPEAWEEMLAYNIQDVETLEEVYEKLKPWAGNLHPSVAPFIITERDVCPACGGHHIHYRGVARTNQNSYARFQCQDCGSWGRSTKRVPSKGTASVVSVR